MTHTTNYKDLRYDREIEFFDKIHVEYLKIRDQQGLIADKIYKHEHKFYNLLSNAIRIDRHPAISVILKEIQERINSEIKVSVFLYQSSVPRAMCTPRLLYNDSEYDKELVILVSQHFFNELSRQEKVAIISHEIAHLLYGHADIPTKVLLEGNFELEEIGDFKFNLLKWSLCKEITSDLFSLVITDFDFNTIANTLIKYNFGFTELAGENTVKLVLDQYDELADAVYENELTTHPLIPLRIKILKDAMDTDLARNWGKKMTEEDYSKYKAEFNALIDERISRIYPEVITESVFKGQEILFEMAAAVALSDGEITQPEIEVLNAMAKTEVAASKYLDQLRIEISNADNRHMVAVQRIIDNSIKKSKDSSFTKHDLVPVVRQLLGVAASDGVIEYEELETIYSYAKHFDYSKNEIILLLAGLGF